ncbi:MAG TPA: NUDIX hydrolase [Thermoleophilaceae bacterium]
MGERATASKRVFYRVAHRILRVWWRLAHPKTRGVRCVLERDGSVLLVRHTYGSREWSLPGGRMRPWEEAAQTAAREMHEELGLELDGWRELATFQSRNYGKRETVFFLGADIGGSELTIDAGEIGEVRWASREEAAATRSNSLREAVAAGVLAS